MTIEEYFGDWMYVIDKEETRKIMGWLKTVNPNTLCPSLPNVFRAFRLCSYHNCKVVMIGLDPYPDKFMGKPRATGILFGNSNDVPEDKLSPSLKIVKECAINFEIPHNIITFDQTLESWAKQGILMINSSLTCEQGNVGSHVTKWIPFVTKLIKNLSKRTGLVYILFGRQAQSFKPYIDAEYNDIIKVEHPAYFARTDNRMPYIFNVMNSILYKRYGEKIILYKEEYENCKL